MDAPDVLAKRYAVVPQNADRFATAVLLLSKAATARDLDSLLLLFIMDRSYARADIAAAQHIVERELGFVPGKR